MAAAIDSTSKIQISDFGDATPADVVEGKTFTSDTGFCVPGELSAVKAGAFLFSYKNSTNDKTVFEDSISTSFTPMTPTVAGRNMWKVPKGKSFTYTLYISWIVSGKTTNYIKVYFYKIGSDGSTTLESSDTLNCTGGSPEESKRTNTYTPLDPNSDYAVELEIYYVNPSSTDYCMGLLKLEEV